MSRNHTPWCARDHRCNLAEHRSREIVVDLPDYGRAVLVRVRTDEGHEQAEIRAPVALAPVEPVAIWPRCSVTSASSSPAPPSPVVPGRAAPPDPHPISRKEVTR